MRIGHVAWKINIVSLEPELLKCEHVFQSRCGPEIQTVVSGFLRTS